LEEITADGQTQSAIAAGDQYRTHDAD
jgi:hypothetical protein